MQGRARRHSIPNYGVLRRRECCLRYAVTRIPDKWLSVVGNTTTTELGLSVQQHQGALQKGALFVLFFDIL